MNRTLPTLAPTIQHKHVHTANLTEELAYTTNNATTIADLAMAFFWVAGISMACIGIAYAFWALVSMYQAITSPEIPAEIELQDLDQILENQV